MAKDRAKDGWLTAKLKDWAFRRLYERELCAEDFVSRVEVAMSEQNVNKTELAKRMECSKANVSRAMNKTTNMTIATMVDMALAVNLRVKIMLDPLDVGDRVFPLVVKNEPANWMPVVVHHASDVAETTCSGTSNSQKAEGTRCGASASEAVAWSTASEAEASFGA